MSAHYRCICSLLFALAIAACGSPSPSGPDASGPLPDAAGSIPDGGPAPDAGECDGGLQTGCAANQKCTSIVDGPELGDRHLACVPNGAIPLDGECQRPEVGAYDDCVAGSHCLGGTCRPICGDAAPDACGDDECTLLAGVDYAVCLQTCDVITQDCPTSPVEQGCYLGSTVPVCVSAGDLVKGDACQFQNSCAPGHACLATSTGRRCLPFCTAPDECNTDDAACGCGGCGEREVCAPFLADSFGTCQDAGEFGSCNCNNEPVCSAWPPWK